MNVEGRLTYNHFGNSVFIRIFAVSKNELHKAADGSQLRPYIVWFGEYLNTT